MTRLRIVYSLWFAGWATAYLLYFGPAIFLWVCCVSNVLVLAGLWLDRPALFSAAALAVLGPQAVWWMDLLGRLILGVHPIGVTTYLFDAATPIFIRGLSSFHVWMPALVLFLVHRSGYRPAALGWIGPGSGILFGLCVFASSPIAPRTANINFVHGLSAPSPHGVAFDLFVALTGYLLLLVLPVHLTLRSLAPRAEVARGL